MINQVDLFTTSPDDFNGVAKQVRMGLLLLPCQNPMDEPPNVRMHMPPNSRDQGGRALRVPRGTRAAARHHARCT